MNQLEEARQAINEIDQEMARLYQKRLEAAKQVAEYKMEHDLPVFDPSREASLIERNLSLVDEPYREIYEPFLQFILKQSKDYQKSLISRDVVAYAGVEGAFAHMTSQQLFPSNRLIGKKNFEEVVQAVVDHQVQYGVIPFENTNAGLVGEVLDLLYHYPVYIVDVYDQKIEQCLLGTSEASLKDIEWVYSKDVALEQAAEFLRALGAQTIAYPNTAMAAQYVATQNDPHKAAVAARENASLYGLKVLASNIEAVSENTTRFLVIARKPAPSKKENMAFLLSVKNEVGHLARCIDILSEHNLNMTSLQSRPLRDHPFEYFFFIQVEGDLSQENIAEVFRQLEPHTILLKNLGSYAIKKRSV